MIPDGRACSPLHALRRQSAQTCETTESRGLSSRQPQRRIVPAEFLEAADGLQQVREPFPGRAAPARWAGVTPALRVVERALLGRLMLRLDYQDKHGGVTQGRLGEPLGFVAGAHLPAWLVPAAQQPQASRLDRTRHAAITAQPAPQAPFRRVRLRLAPAAAPRSRSMTDPRQASRAAMHPPLRRP
jgi:hypothetical protein